ncbi:MAG: radical SAM protein [Candidatus Bathyarchaeota archaeon]|nr:radical SAM protein [Candidatus Bathyarchaeota archaeon]
MNPYNGCRHGCLYCYARKYEYNKWIKPTPRKDVIEKLKKDIKVLKSTDKICNIQDILLGSNTDSYQPLEAEYKQTRQVIDELISNELPFSILTKSNRVLRDIDLFKGYQWCRVGVTLTSFDETFRRDLEPYTVSYDERIKVLVALKENGISTYLSGEPIMPVEASNPLEIVHKLKDVVDLFEFGLYDDKEDYDYTPVAYKKHYNDDTYHAPIFREQIQYCQENNINYCNSSHSRAFFKKNNLPFQKYPLLKPPMPKAQQCLTAFC